MYVSINKSTTHWHGSFSHRKYIKYVPLHHYLLYDTAIDREMQWNFSTFGKGKINVPDLPNWYMGIKQHCQSWALVTFKHQNFMVSFRFPWEKCAGPAFFVDPFHPAVNLFASARN